MNAEGLTSNIIAFPIREKPPRDPAAAAFAGIERQLADHLPMLCAAIDTLNDSDAALTEKLRRLEASGSLALIDELCSEFGAGAGELETLAEMLRLAATRLQDMMARLAPQTA